MNDTTIASNLTCNYTEYKSSEEMYMDFSYWTENVVQSVIGVVGITANTIAIPILISRDMFSIFNCLLMFLAIFDNIFIICQLLEAQRKMTNTNDELDEDIFSQAHEYAFAYFLYQLHSFVLVCSMYITVALALERYQAVWKPVEYHIKTKGINPWTRVILYYVLPVILFSSLINIPKWFEIKLEEYSQSIFVNNSFNESINLTIAEPTALRINHIYVVWWANVVTLTVQGIIPFGSLCIMNYRIYSVIIRRGRDNPKLSTVPESEGSQMIQMNVNNNQNQKRKQEEDRKRKDSKLLLIIVLFYLIFHFPRFLINLHEFFHLDIIKEIMNGSEEYQKRCDSFPIWVLACTSVSNCLLTLNSSCNFFIYCFMSSIFREVACQWAVKGFKIVSRFFAYIQLRFRTREEYVASQNTITREDETKNTYIAKQISSDNP